MRGDLRKRPSIGDRCARKFLLLERGDASVYTLERGTFLEKCDTTNGPFSRKVSYQRRFPTPTSFIFLHRESFGSRHLFSRFYRLGPLETATVVSAIDAHAKPVSLFCVPRRAIASEQNRQAVNLSQDSRRRNDSESITPRDNGSVTRCPDIRECFFLAVIGR